jgi:DNA-binding NarL/FixJ family response regulator
VVSRHPLVRAGLTALLAEYPDRVHVVDVSSQDGHLGGQDAAVYDLAALVDGADDDVQHVISSRIPVVALTPPSPSGLGERAVAVGVAEVVPMDITAAGLVLALERAASGRSVSADRCAAQGAEKRRRALEVQHGLSERESDILLLIAAGRMNQEIADQLYLSINSIKTYIRSAYKKIGVRTRAQAVLWVCQQDPSLPTRSAGMQRSA